MSTPINRLLSVLSQDDINTLLDAIDDGVPDRVTSNETVRTQVGGDHYAKLVVQPWDALQSWLGKDGYRAYLRGNAVKYLCRAGSKGDAKLDYQKARHYLEELLRTFDP